MKILIVICEFRHGGAQRVVSRLSQEWERQGHSVTIALFDADRPAYIAGGKLHDLKTPASRNIIVKFWRTILRVIGLAHLIRHGQYTHLIGFMENANFPLIIASLLSGTLSKTIVSTRISPSHIYRFQRLLLRVLYHLPKKIVVISASAKRQLANMGIPEAKIDFIPNPAPTSQLYTGDTAQACVAKPLPRPQFKGKYILAVGRFIKHKGFDLLLIAYTRLAKTAPPLVILGDGKLLKAITRLAKQLGIGDRVHFMGAVDNPQNWYAHAELFVLSSRWEGWPNVLVEAMAHGCPVVSFACPTGPDEIITHNENGLLVRDGAVEELAHAIDEVLANPSLRQKLGVAGQKRAGDFDIGKIAPLWL